MKMRLFRLFILLFIFVFLVKGYENKIFSLNFVDEDENFVSGKYITQGEKLYQDLFTHHQPATFIISSYLQRLVPINSLPQLVKRHREFVMAWSAIWSIILLYWFGWWIIPLVFSYEITKYQLYGHLFLAESLSVYPLICLTLIALNNVRNKNYKHLLAAGFCSSLLIFLLSPLLPLVIFLNAIIFFKGKWPTINIVFRYLLGFLIPVILILPFISIGSYIHIISNIVPKYNMPTLGENGGRISFQSALIPFASLFWKANFSSFLNVIRGVNVIYLIITGALIVKRQYLLALLGFLILALSFIRYINLEIYLFNGFHVLPWWGILLCIVFYSIQHLYIKCQTNKCRILFGAFLFLLPLAVFLPVKDYFLIKSNRDTDQYINYSQSFDNGEAVRIMKIENDRLFVAPDQFLIYYQAQITHAGDLINLYPWMETVPEISQRINNMFTTHPPEFFYCDCEQLTIKQYLNKYIRISKDGRETNLFILKNMVRQLTPEKIRQLDYYHFTVPGINSPTSLTPI